MTKPFHPRRAALTLVVAGAAALALPVGAVLAAQPAPGPAGGHGQVVAQGAVEFADGPVQWAVSNEVLRASTPGVPAGGPAPTFLAVTGGALVVTDDSSPLARVGAGEGWFVPAGSAATAAAADGLDTAFHRIGLTADGSGVGEPFTPGASIRDVDLVRDVLGPGETLPVTDSDAAPALVVVTIGGVTVAGAPTGSVDVTAGTPAVLDGALTILNPGTEPAAVLVAVVGPVVQATTPATAPATTAAAPAPTTPSAPDADGDGLSDEDEIRLGTMVDDPDSDGDQLSDGDEVHRYGTDPLSSRTDSDHLEDGLEIERGTDPLDPDTDDDGCQDSSDDNPLTGDGDCDGDTLSFDQERQLGTDPANPDTDDDGMDDDMDPSPLTPDNGAPPPPEPSPTEP